MLKYELYWKALSSFVLIFNVGFVRKSRHPLFLTFKNTWYSIVKVIKKSSFRQKYQAHVHGIGCQVLEIPSPWQHPLDANAAKSIWSVVEKKTSINYQNKAAQNIKLTEYKSRETLILWHLMSGRCNTLDTFIDFSLLTVTMPLSLRKRQHFTLHRRQAWSVLLILNAKNLESKLRRQASTPSGSFSHCSGHVLISPRPRLPWC